MMTESQDNSANLHQIVDLVKQNEPVVRFFANVINGLSEDIKGLAERVDELEIDVNRLKRI